MLTKENETLKKIIPQDIDKPLMNFDSSALDSNNTKSINSFYDKIKTGNWYSNRKLCISSKTTKYNNYSKSSCRISSPKSGTTKYFFDKVKRIAPSIDKLKSNNGISGWVFSNDKELLNIDLLQANYCEKKIIETSKSYSFFKQIIKDKQFFLNYVSTINQSGICFLRDNLIHQMVYYSLILERTY